MDTAHFQIWFFLLIILLGFAGGFMAGMLGVGGGIVFVPVIQEIVRYHPVLADKVPYVLANSLLIVFFVGITGTIKQYKLKNTDLKASLVTGIAAVASSLTLTYLLQLHQINDQKAFAYIFSGVLVLTAMRMWYGRNRNRETETAPAKLPALLQFIPAGFFAGIITAITGLGGGVVMVPYFNKILKLPIKFATGLSLSVIPIIAFPLLVFYMVSQPAADLYPGWQTGHILWPAVVPILLAAGIAAPFGVRTAHKMSSKTLLTVFMTFILINLIKILFF